MTIGIQVSESLFSILGSIHLGVELPDHMVILFELNLRATEQVEANTLCGWMTKEVTLL